MKKCKVKYESFLENPGICCTKCGRKLRLWDDQVMKPCSELRIILSVCQGTLFVCNSTLSTCESNGSSKEKSQGKRQE